MNIKKIACTKYSDSKQHHNYTILYLFVYSLQSLFFFKKSNIPFLSSTVSSTNYRKKTSTPYFNITLYAKKKTTM